LEGKTYYVTDYVNGKDYGTVTGPLGTVKVTFTDSLLLQASPEKAASGGR
jgi:hypothetical protein